MAAVMAMVDATVVMMVEAAAMMMAVAMTDLIPPTDDRGRDAHEICDGGCDGGAAAAAAMTLAK